MVWYGAVCGWYVIWCVYASVCKCVVVMVVRVYMCVYEGSRVRVKSYVYVPPQPKVKGEG